MKKAVSALVYRFIALVLSIIGVVMHCMFNQQDNGSFMGNHAFAYFTLQTNLLVMFIFAVLLIKTLVVYIKTHKLEVVSFYPSMHLACTFYITITLLVYWLVLCPTLGMSYKNPMLIASNIFLHTITPLCAIFDCVFFFKHGSLKKKDAFLWLIYPLLYLISVIIIANVPGSKPYYYFPINGTTIALRYPYPFLEPQIVGVGGMIGVIIALMVMFTLFGLLYIVVDNKIAVYLEKRHNKNIESCENN